jgi:decaprenyl-phosphate phosphoribosyltransferase
LKNVLVLAVPGAAGVLDERDVLARTAIAFVALCLASSAGYFLNDALDATADQQHAVKRLRPVAAGQLTTTCAKATSILLLVAAIVLSISVDGGDLTVVVVSYAAITFAYSFWLKRVPVLDIAAVAAGFVLRAAAGGVANDIRISGWFLAVAAAGSVLMAAGKRWCEQRELGAASGAHRAILDAYPPGVLKAIHRSAAVAAVVAYAFWSVDGASRVGDVAWFQASIVPFALAILRYDYDIEHASVSAPEDIVLSDHVLQLIGLVWLAVFIVGVRG